MASKFLLAAFFSFIFLFFATFLCQTVAASDLDTLDAWVKEAVNLGLGQAEIEALNALKEVLSSVKSDSKQMLGMAANERGMNAADEAMLRRLSTINGGVKSPLARTLEELPNISLRAKKRLWLDGYDKETEDADEDQDNAKRRVKMVLTKLEENKESDLFEKIKPRDYKQLKDLDDYYASRRFKDILTDLSRKSIVQLPGGLSLALKDAAELGHPSLTCGVVMEKHLAFFFPLYLLLSDANVIVAYSNLAVESVESNDLPDTVRKAIELMREVRAVTTDDAKVIGTIKSNSASFESLDTAYLGRIESLELNDQNVMALQGLVASLRLITLKRINVAYVELSKSMTEYKWVDNGIKAMEPIEQTVYDLDTFGLRADPENARELDRVYIEKIDGLRKNERLKWHFGLRKRMDECIKKLNNDFDSIMRRKATLINGEAKRLAEKLAELDGTGDMNLFGDPTDIEGLDAEYVRKMGEIQADAKTTGDYEGIKVRSEMAKQRLSRNYFLVADKKGMVSSSMGTAQVQDVLRKSMEILSATEWAQILGNPDINEQEIEEAFKKRVGELNLDERELSKMPGLREALGEVVETLEVARQVLTDQVRPAPASMEEEDRERRQEETEEELQKEYDNNPPKEISGECRDEAPNCRENIFLCKNQFYVILMHNVCKKTCAICMDINDAANCEDRNATDCQLWGHSFCTSLAYSKGMKMAQCAKFCGLCPK